MAINIFRLIAIIGLSAIISGTLLISHKKRYTYSLFILGGIFLAIYSFYIQDIIFIILQTVFVVSAIYGLIKLNKKQRK